MYRLVLPRRWGLVTLLAKVARIAAMAGVTESETYSEVARRAAISSPDQSLADVLAGLELAVAEGTWPAR